MYVRVLQTLQFARSGRSGWTKLQKSKLGDSFELFYRCILPYINNNMPASVPPLRPPGRSAAVCMHSN